MACNITEEKKTLSKPTRQNWRNQAPTRKPPTQRISTTTTPFPPRRPHLIQFIGLLSSTINVSPELDFHRAIIKQLTVKLPTLSEQNRRISASKLNEIIHQSCHELNLEKPNPDFSRHHFIDHPELQESLIDILIRFIKLLQTQGFDSNKGLPSLQPTLQSKPNNKEPIDNLLKPLLEEEWQYHLEQSPRHALDALADLLMLFGSLFSDLFLCSTFEDDNQPTPIWEPPRPSPYKRKKDKGRKTTR